MADLTFEQGEAARRFERTAERVLTHAKADKRLVAADAFRAAKAALEPAEIAALDMVLLKGRKPADIARAANTTPQRIDGLYRSALTKLAAHYEGAADHGFRGAEHG